MYKVEEPNGHCFWMEEVQDEPRLRHTFAAGYQIHVRPKVVLPGKGIFRMPIKLRKSPFAHQIDCCKFLRDDEINILREYFPGYAGAHVLVSGRIIILFPDARVHQRCYEMSIMEELGGAEVGFGVAFHIATCIQTGHGIAAAPGELRSTASLGLRLKLHDSIECITTVTHAVIKTADTDSAL